MIFHNPGVTRARHAAQRHYPAKRGRRKQSLRAGRETFGTCTACFLTGLVEIQKFCFSLT
jgi:hypothetical protein